MTYEKVRVLFDAIMTGERDLAKAVDSNLHLDADAKKARTTVHFLRFDELLKIWIAVLAKLPVLRKKFDDSKSDPEQVLRDALDMLEGEGTALHSKLSGLVHLNPTWLASCVRPLADHRLHTTERRRAIAESWVARSGERVEHSGWLEKSSDDLKQWKRRFFAFDVAVCSDAIPRSTSRTNVDKAKEVVNCAHWVHRSVKVKAHGTHRGRRTPKDLLRASCYDARRSATNGSTGSPAWNSRPSSSPARTTTP